MNCRRPLLLCYMAIGLALLVILMGAWTRIMDAGLGCPDWPGCFGQLIVPASQEQIALAQHRFGGIEIDLFKGWVEMTHRYMAASLGALILLLAFIGWRRRKEPGYPLTCRLCYWCWSCFRDCSACGRSHLNYFLRW